MAQPTNTDELDEKLRQYFIWVYEAGAQDRGDLPELTRQFREDLAAYIEREKVAARVEAYQHILLSDNGMQEPLKSWLEGYIVALTGGSDE